MTNDPEQAEGFAARYEETFLAALAGCLDRDDFTEYSAARCRDEGRLCGRSRVYTGDKLDRAVITRYVLKRGQHGVVIFGYPKVEYEIPSFVFYFGGQPPAKTLTILDLVPPSRRTDMRAFRALSERTRASTELSATRVDFLRSVSSPYILHCAFRPLDPEDLLSTFTQTLDIWRSVHIEPAQPDEHGSRMRERTRSILRMKETLHRNSPAIGVFTRAFGKEMSDVFALAEYGGHPGVTISQAADPAAGETWRNKRLGITWTAEAQERVLEAPLFLRRMIRRRIEQEAVASKLATVSVELVEHCERKYRG